MIPSTVKKGASGGVFLAPGVLPAQVSGWDISPQLFPGGRVFGRRAETGHGSSWDENGEETTFA